MTMKKSKQGFEAVEKPGGGFAVTPTGMDEVGAYAKGGPRDAQRAATDAVFKDSLAKPAKVSPGGKDDFVSIPASVLAQLFEEIVPEEYAQDAYKQAFPSLSQAIQAALLDKDHFRQAYDAGDKRVMPFESLRSILYPATKTKKAND